jgi:hypothetical protein
MEHSKGKFVAALSAFTRSNRSITEGYRGHHRDFGMPFDVREPVFWPAYGSLSTAGTRLIAARGEPSRKASSCMCGPRDFRGICDSRGGIRGLRPEAAAVCTLRSGARELVSIAPAAPSVTISTSPGQRGQATRPPRVKRARLLCVRRLSKTIRDSTSTCMWLRRSSRRGATRLLSLDASRVTGTAIPRTRTSSCWRTRKATVLDRQPRPRARLAAALRRAGRRGTSR